MEYKVFKNEFFDSWMSRKSEEISSKIGRETITTEEMIILLLNQQTNHFDHIEQEIKKIDHRYENQTKVLMWSAGFIAMGFSGIYAKLFGFI
jgi:hypothetical protein